MDYYDSQLRQGVLSFLVNPGELRSVSSKYKQAGRDLRLDSVTVGGKPLSYGGSKKDNASMYGHGAALRLASGRGKGLRVRAVSNTKKPVRVTIRYAS